MKKTGAGLLILYLLISVLACSKKHNPGPNNNNGSAGGNNGGKTGPDTVVTVSTVAGDGGKGNSDGTGDAASFANPTGITIDPTGSLYVLCYSSSTIRKVDPTGVVTTLNLAGKLSPNNLSGITCDKLGNIYVTDNFEDIIEQVTPALKVSIFAGSSNTSSYDQDGPGYNSSFAAPGPITRDRNNNLYVDCTGFGTVRQITPAAIVTTLEGDDKSGFLHPTPEVTAGMYEVTAIAADSIGNVYVYSADSKQLYEIDPVAKTYKSLAGDGKAGLVDGLAPSASFNSVTGIAIDKQGNVYVTDTNEVRLIANGIVKTIAGAHNASFNDGPGATALFRQVQGITIDAQGNLYVVDAGNYKIRKITIAIH